MLLGLSDAKTYVGMYFLYTHSNTHPQVNSHVDTCYPCIHTCACPPTGSHSQRVHIMWRCRFRDLRGVCLILHSRPASLCWLLTQPGAGKGTIAPDPSQRNQRLRRKEGVFRLRPHNGPSDPGSSLLTLLNGDMFETRRLHLGMSVRTFPEMTDTPCSR